MTIIPPGFAQVSLPFQHASLNRRAFCVFGLELAGLVDPFDIANAVVSLWDDTMGVHNDTDVTFGPAEVTVGQDGGEPITGVGNLALLGNSAYPDSLNGGQAVLLRKGTARGGRRGRGRMFVPWAIADAEVNEIGILDTTAVSGRQTSANAFLAGLADDDLGGMVLLHDVGISTPGDPTPVTSLIVDRLVGSQRRRLARRV